MLNAKNENYSPAGKGKERVSSASSINCEPHLLLQNDTIPDGFSYYGYDDHHHWTTWRTESFLQMCKHFNWKVIEYCDVDDKVGNGFTVVLQK